MVDWFGWLCGWVVVCVAGCVVGWLFGWLCGWLAGWLGFWLLVCLFWMPNVPGAKRKDLLGQLYVLPP